MSELTLHIPDDLDRALNVPANELAHEVSLAAAVKLFELGKTSSGKAAELVSMPKPLFLGTLAELGVSAPVLTPTRSTSSVRYA